MLIFGDITSVSVRQAEDVERVVGGHGHVLMAGRGIRHRAAGDGSTQVGLPQQLTGARVQREEVALASSREEQVRGGGEDAALRVIDHLEVPLLFSGLRSIARTAP